MVGLPNESRDTIALYNLASSPKDRNATADSSADPAAADDTAGETVVVVGVPSEASESAEEDMAAKWRGFDRFLK